jgi:hypothetical protein
MRDQELCTKKGCDEPRSSEKPWCKKHLAEYQREYQANRVDKSEAHGFASGVTAMRLALVEAFNKIGANSFTGYDAAKWVLGAPSPKPD